MQAAIEAYDAELVVEQTQFYASAARGRPQVRSEVGRSVALRYRGNSYSVKVYRLGTDRYRAELDGSRVDATVDRLGPFESCLNLQGQHFHIVSMAQGRNYRIEVDGVSHRVERDDGGLVHSPSPAVVVSINVKPGDVVSVGDRLAVLEAMKMEMLVAAPFSGRVRQVLTMPNVQVDTGTPLLQIEPEATGDTASAEGRVDFGASSVPDRTGEPILSSCRSSLGELRQLMLGFDVDPKSSTQLLAQWSESCLVDSDEIRQAEDEILSIFVDICSLFQQEPEVIHRASGEAPSAEAYLFAHLRMLDTRGEALPAAFIDSLKRALAHYDVHTLDRSPQLEASLLWICKSHQRVEQQIAPILGILARRLRPVGVAPPRAEESLRTLLDRMISITNGNFSALSDLAREVRYRHFDQPLFERARKQVYDQVEDHLAYLSANPNAADRLERMRALVDCPQPLVTRLSGHFADAGPNLRKMMLEAMTGRYYRIRNLTGLRSFEVDGRDYASAEYDYEGKHIHVFAMHSDRARFADAVPAMSRLIDPVPADHDIVIDFYTWNSGGLDDAESNQREIHQILNGTNFSRRIRRIVVVVAGPGRGEGMAGMLHFTYRPGAAGYEEEKIYRGLHPMMGKRLHLQRLSNFTIDRLPSVEDVYLLHAVARDNPKDERLFACAEVRDVTPVRDETGRIVKLPCLERMLAEALAGIRLFQSRRRNHERLHWNRVFLYVWPPLTLGRDELHDIVHRLAPTTEGMGLEQVVVRARIPDPATGELRDMQVRISTPGGREFLLRSGLPTNCNPLSPCRNMRRKLFACASAG